MWKRNFMFRASDATPLTESENELFHDTDPAMDSAGLQLEKFLSVWVQGDGEDEKPPPLPTCMSARRRWIFRSVLGFFSLYRGVRIKLSSCSRQVRRTICALGSRLRLLKPGKQRTSTSRCFSSWNEPAIRLFLQENS